MPSDYELEDIKPYLRPMSSVTKDEKDYFDQSLDLFYAEAYNEEVVCATRMIDFFNEHHLDYRGLIPMGLALEAPEGMYLHFGDMDVKVNVVHKDKL